MHILIDVQGLQSASKCRGIGRSTLAISRAIIRNSGNHRISILLNGMFPIENIRKVRYAYQDILPTNEIYTFSAHGPVAACNTANIERNRAAYISRDVAIAHINPDIVLVISFFEGHIDEYVVSIPDYPVKWRTVCVCHDLIPLLNPEKYLTDISFRQFYFKKLKEYERADAIFAVSKSAAEEVKKYTNIDPSRIINISSAAGPEFRVLSLTIKQKNDFRQRYHLPDNFIMALAMIEPRKNIEALIKAYSKLPKILRNNFPIVLACAIHPAKLVQIKRICTKYGLSSKQVLFTGYLSDKDLITLYNLCKLFVFPSLHEGFGLPPLEAMSCGAPTISSNTTSLPEVVGLPEAMFDPTDIQAIYNILLRALKDHDFYQKLKEHSLKQAEKFSWDNTAKLALAEFGKIMTSKMKPPLNAKAFTNEAIRSLAKRVLFNQEIDRLGTAWALAQNSFSEQTIPRLWIDVTELIIKCNTLVKLHIYKLITALLTTMPANCLVKVVYCLHNSGYRYATVKIDGNLITAHNHKQDMPVFFTHHDILLIIDLSRYMSFRQQAELDSIIRIGTKVVFWFSENIFNEISSSASQKVFQPEIFSLHAMLRYADIIICSSEAIAIKLQYLKTQWMNEITFNKELQIDIIKNNTLPISRGEIHKLIAQIIITS